MRKELELFCTIVFAAEWFKEKKKKEVLFSLYSLRHFSYSSQDRRSYWQVNIQYGFFYSAYFINISIMLEELLQSFKIYRPLNIWRTYLLVMDSLNWGLEHNQSKKPDRVALANVSTYVIKGNFRVWKWSGDGQGSGLTCICRELQPLALGST